MDHGHGFSSELSWKIFLDRYALKDPDRAFSVGDLAMVTTVEDPKWPQSEVARVTSIDGETLHLTLLTGPEKNSSLTRKKRECDRIIETSLDMAARRMAKAVASVEDPDKREAVAERFAEEIGALRFVPAGRIWSGAGTDQKVTLNNCFVIGNPKDSRGGIIQTLGQMVEIMSRSGGVGINVSTLRPAHAPVRGVNGRSSGAVSWMDLYSRATGLVEQGGSRRGALMLQIADWHPDVLRFINAKRQAGMVENANISVRVSDALMEAVKNDGDWYLRFPDTKHPAYDSEWDGDLQKWIRAGRPVVTYETIRARELWDALIQSAWASAEPGVVFSDRAESESNSWYFNPLVCTNPCAEQPLPAWGVCDLGHINLSRFYDSETHAVNMVGLEKTIQTAVRFLDNIVDVTVYPLKETALNQKMERRIGLGTMGLGELLIKLGLKYGSDEAVEFTEKLFSSIATTAYEASSDLAAEKGSFPAFDAEKFVQSGFVQRMPSLVPTIKKQGMRNVTVLTQAPTGSVGTMVGTSTGIEPYFAFQYIRQSRLGKNEQYVSIAQEWLDVHPGETLPDYFVGAMDLSPREHVRMQATIQRWVDSSISKTVNAPEHYTVEDTKELYELAYELGCKGVTIYRDKSRHEQVLSTEDNPKEPEYELIERPESMAGRAYRIDTHFGTLNLDVHELSPGDPFEIFVSVGAVGSDLLADAAGIGRLASTMLRMNSHLSRTRRLELIIDKLQNIGGASSSGFGPNKVTSLPSAVALGLQKYLKDLGGEKMANASAPEKNRNVDRCPDCGNYSVIKQEGCRACQSCGWSAC